jgi:hypothetical protein
MKDVHAQAITQEDFTADVIAEKAGVSLTWVYSLVGEEFKELRSKLKGKRRSPKSLLSELRTENKELRRLLRNAEAAAKSVVSADVAEAIKHIELLEEESRMLRARVAMLERRLKESEQIVVFEEETVAPENAQPQNRHLSIVSSPKSK